MAFVLTLGFLAGCTIGMVLIVIGNYRIMQQNREQMQMYAEAMRQICALPRCSLLSVKSARIEIQGRQEDRADPPTHEWLKGLDREYEEEDQW